MTEIARVRVELTPRQTSAFDILTSSDDADLCYGGAKGGGKSYLMCIWAYSWTLWLIDYFALQPSQYPLPVGFLGRMRSTDFNKTTLETWKKIIPSSGYEINETKKEIIINGSAKILFGGLDDRQTLNKFNSAELAFIGIDQAEETARDDISVLEGSLRLTYNGKVPPYKVLYTANPAKCWLKNEFRKGQRSGAYFVQALPSDNPHLPSSYEKTLRKAFGYNEALLGAYLYGEWDVQIGQYFEELRRDVHLIKPFSIPSHWRKFGALDWGYSHPASFGWLAHDEDGNLYLYRAYLQNRQRPDQIAEYLHKFTDTKELYDIQAGHDCWTTRDGSPTIADQFESLPDHLRIRLSKANIDRLNGAAEVRKRLAHLNLPEGMTGPKLFIFDTPDCEPVFNCLNSMVHDDNRIEDVKKVDVDGDDIYSGDDHYDMVRYACMSYPLKTKPLEQPYVIPTVEEERRRKFLEARDKMRKRNQRSAKRWDATMGRL